MFEAEKDKNQKNIKSKQKYQTSKPSYLIPFNKEKFLKNYKKRNSPRKRTKSADTTNKENIEINLKIQKIINSTRRKKYNFHQISKIEKYNEQDKLLVNKLNSKDYKILNNSSTNIKNIIHNKIKKEIIKNFNSPKKEKLNKKTKNSNSKINNIIESKRKESIVKKENNIQNNNEIEINKKSIYPIKIKFKKKTRSLSRPDRKSLIKQLQESQNLSFKSFYEKTSELNKSYNSVNLKRNKEMNISLKEKLKESTPVKQKKNFFQSNNLNNKKDINNKKIKNRSDSEIIFSPFMKNKIRKQNINSNNKLTNKNKISNLKNSQSTNNLKSSKSKIRIKINLDILKNSSTSSLDKSTIKMENKINKSLSIIENNNKNNSNSFIATPKIIKKIREIKSICKKGFSGINTKKINQDNLLIVSNFINYKSHLLCVCDGHGIYGHLVSSYIIKTLPLLLTSDFQKENITLYSPFKYIKNQIIKSFQKLNKNLLKKSEINTIFSGSTCIIIIITEEKIICSNCGDSRGIIGKYKNKNWISFNLSRDHKPNEQDEKKRILSKNGIIEPYKDENNNPIGPDRVWVPNDKVPGLAMSRSLGDEMAHRVGVTSVPEVIEVEFCIEDKFIIVATDGLWEFINSDECVKIVGEFYLKNDIEGAINFLYRESSKRWILEEDVIDDISIIIAFF